MWVPQWPLPKEKLMAAKDLVKEQLTLGHLEPSTSPWNTPIFVIKKKLGKWRLLHDLRKINSQMQVMGPIQRGLPLLSAIPKDWPIIIIDIKDCFFSTPLAAVDCKRFAACKSCRVVQLSALGDGGSRIRGSTLSYTASWRQCSTRGLASDERVNTSS